MGGNDQFMPISVSLRDRRCMVVGGGISALREVERLLECGAPITVIAPKLHEKLDFFAGREMITVEFQEGGTMTEIPGDGVDNDADGQQDENVEALAGYSITCVLFDSGSLKDDIFNLSISGYCNLGTTPAGGLRSYGLDLSPGSYTATVTVVLAPDNVGTYTLVILENGRSIASATDGPPQGAAVTIPFTVTGE